MVRTRSLALAAAMGTLLIAVMALPAAAANPRLAFVNGIPGTKVDVCVGNNEIRSNLKYGQWFQRQFVPGNYVFRFRRAAPGRCTGRLLGREDGALLADTDFTLVAAKRQDKVVLFANLSAAVGPLTWWRGIRHAADVGEVVFGLETTSSISPTALPPSFSKGAEAVATGANWTQFYLAATQANQSAAMVEKHFLVVEGRRLEIILVGTKPRNARFVVINRATLPL